MTDRRAMDDVLNIPRSKLLDLAFRLVMSADQLPCIERDTSDEREIEDARRDVLGVARWLLAVGTRATGPGADSPEKLALQDLCREAARVLRAIDEANGHKSDWPVLRALLAEQQKGLK